MCCPDGLPVPSRLQGAGHGHLAAIMRMDAQRGELSSSAALSFDHELKADRRGVGFAYGGVSPGTLHARGQLVRVHTVHYSIGLAGRYRLHGVPCGPCPYFVVAHDSANNGLLAQLGFANSQLRCQAPRSRLKWHRALLMRHRRACRKIRCRFGE